MNFPCSAAVFSSLPQSSLTNLLCSCAYDLSIACAKTVAVSVSAVVQRQEIKIEFSCPFALCIELIK